MDCCLAMSLVLVAEVYQILDRSGKASIDYQLFVPLSSAKQEIYLLKNVQNFPKQGSSN